MNVEQALKKARAGALKRAVECDDGRWVCRNGHVLGPKPARGESNGEWAVKAQCLTCRFCIDQRRISKYWEDPVRHRAATAAWRAENRERDLLYKKQRREQEKATYGVLLCHLDRVNKSKHTRTLGCSAANQDSMYEAIHRLFSNPPRMDVFWQAYISELRSRLGVRPGMSRRQLAKACWWSASPWRPRQANGFIVATMTPEQRAQYEAVKAMTFRYKKGYGWWDASKDGETPWENQKQETSSKSSTKAKRSSGRSRPKKKTSTRSAASSGQRSKNSSSSKAATSSRRARTSR